MRVAWLGALLLLLPSPARAELHGCLLTGAAAGGAASLSCDSLERCTVGDTCGGGTPCEALTGVCLPSCSTLIGCDADEDCGSLRAGGTCERFASDSGFDGGICTAPDVPVTYCNGGSDLGAEAFLACHTLPFSDTLAPSWFDGDCDRDGCPNASDAVPCAAGGACTRPGPLVPTCPQRLIDVGPERCVFPGTEAPSCATAHACEGGADCPLGFVCDDGTCEPGVCTALYSCRNVRDCPDDTELGTPVVCLPTVLLDPGLGRGDGFCLFSSFGVTAACADLDEARTCFFRDGVFSNDFFQGDCDLDGCPNGLDSSPCAASADRCMPEGFSPACDTPIPPARDAGASPDASLPDGGGSAFDAGNVAFDGGSTDRVTFGGGGGCVCTAASRPSAPTWGLALLLASLLGLCLARVTLLQKRAARPAWRGPSGRAR